jgi:dihydroflavonol-4-reductase
MKIGITGVSGHIGNNLVRRLLQEDCSLRVFIHSTTCELEGMPLEMVRGDLSDKEAVRSFVKGLDAVFHLAARVFVNGKQKWKYFRENMQMSGNMLEAVKEEGCRYIYFSSVHAYDPFPVEVPLDETRRLVTDDRFLYSRSKALAQEAVLAAAAEGLDALVINPSAVIGPYDLKPSLLGQAIMLMAQRKLPGLIPGGYDWVDVRDVAEGAVAALRKGRKGEAYLLSGHWESLKGLHEMILELTGGQRRLPVFPFWTARLGVPFMSLLARLQGRQPLYTRETITILKEANPRVSHEKASRELGYRPRPLKVTVEDTLNWFRERAMIE